MLRHCDVRKAVAVKFGWLVIAVRCVDGAVIQQQRHGAEAVERAQRCFRTLQLLERELADVVRDARTAWPVFGLLDRVGEFVAQLDNVHPVEHHQFWLVVLVEVEPGWLTLVAENVVLLRDQSGQRPSSDVGFSRWITRSGSVAGSTSLRCGNFLRGMCQRSRLRPLRAAASASRWERPVDIAASTMSASASPSLSKPLAAISPKRQAAQNA